MGIIILVGFHRFDVLAAYRHNGKRENMVSDTFSSLPPPFPKKNNCLIPVLCSYIIRLVEPKKISK